VGLEELDAAPPPPLLDPLTALSHLPLHRLTPPQALDWRCGRRLEADADHPPDGAVAVIGPDGRLAGIARADGAGGLQPKLVFEAAG
jgi:tRNA pseudouridine55 synthase